MSTVNIVLGIILIVAAVFLVVSVLFQSGKSKNLSGTIAGASETFFGKNKGKTADKMLSRATTVVAIVFVVLVIVIYVFQKDNFVTQDSFIDDYIEGLESTGEKTDDTGDVTDTDADAETTAAENESDTADSDTSETEDSADSGDVAE